MCICLGGSLSNSSSELDECKQKMNDLEDELEEVVAILEEDYGPDNELGSFGVV